MKFDKSRIYTAVNADEVKVGSRGYFADSIRDIDMIEKLVRNGCKGLHTVSKIGDSTQLDRFYDELYVDYGLFYLVEESESSPEIKEVTAAEWDNKPRVMKVWDEDYKAATETKVVHILYNKDILYPVVTVRKNTDVVFYGHCAELEPAKEAKEPESEKHYRSYNSADELIEDYKRRFCPDCKSIPAIWVKNAADTPRQVIAIADNGVRLVGKKIYFVDYSDFLDVYTYPDGTHCGMEE